MKKQTQISLIVLFMVVTIAITVFIILMNKKKQITPAEESNTLPGSNGTSSGTASVFPLKYGSKGTYVRQLQSKLNAHIQLYALAIPFTYLGQKRTAIQVDGDFGAETLAAVQWKFQTNSVTKSQLESL